MGKLKFDQSGKTVIYDGRILFIGVGQFDENKPAQILVDDLAALGSSSWILEEVIKSSVGNLRFEINGKKIVESSDQFALVPKTTVQLSKVEFAKGYSWHGFGNRKFRGTLNIRWGAQNSLDCITTTDLETVLSGVVPSEISSKAAIGALEAQTVAARGEILSKMGLRHLGEKFDFCSEQHCQVYSGETPESIAVGKAVSNTQGILLANAEGGFVDAVYSANCGGHGEANHIVWTSFPDPQLIGVWDSKKISNLDLTSEDSVKRFIRAPPPCYCDDPTLEGGDKFRWKKEISAKEWGGVVERGGVGSIRNFKEFSRGNSGRLYKITIEGEKGSRTIMKELNIRKLFGGLRSACFVADWKRNSKGFIIEGLFEGAGWGHGVGMCQTGAQGMARSGENFQKILLHYFPGSHLMKVY
ncbi:SpoIID/LytB domain-containing protein, partial [bacterium]|nr:SpoIID/LytB domain-containing protein [bacterium]